MMNSFFKKIICLFLCLRFLPAHGEEFNFHQQAQDLLDSENNIVIPAFIENLYHSDLYSIDSSINTLGELMDSSTIDMETTYLGYSDSGKKLEKLVDESSTPSLDTLSKLIHLQMQSKFDKYAIDNKVNFFQTVYNTLSSYRNVLDNYCQKTSSQLNPANFSLTTQNNVFDIPLPNYYTQRNVGESWKEDTHAQAMGWLGFGATFLSAFLTDAFTYGFAAAFSHFGFTIVDHSLVVTLTGAAVFWLLGSISVLYAIVSICNYLDNEKKREEAQDRINHLKQAMIDASNYYLNNTILKFPDKFRNLGLDLCQNQATWKVDMLFNDLDAETQNKAEGSNACRMMSIGSTCTPPPDKPPETSPFYPKYLNKYLKQKEEYEKCHQGSMEEVCTVTEDNMYFKSKDTIEKFFEKFDQANYPKYSEMISTQEKINELKIQDTIEKYESQLVAKFTKDIIQSTIAKAQSDSLLAKGIEVYNEQIKENLHHQLTTDYIQNMSNCQILKKIVTRDLAKIDSAAKEIQTFYKDDLNQNDSFFTTDLPADVTQFKTTYENDVKLCKPNNISPVLMSMNQLNTSLTADKTPKYDLYAPIRFSYKDKSTDYSLAVDIVSRDYIDYLTNGLFKFGMIGYYKTSEVNDDMKDKIMKENTRSFELEKVTHNFYLQNVLNMPNPPAINIPTINNNILFESEQQKSSSFIEIQHNYFDSLNATIDQTQNELSLGLTPNSLNDFQQLSEQIETLKKTNNSNFSDFNLSLQKFNTLKNSYFYDGLYIGQSLNKKPPLFYYTPSSTPQGDELRRLTNLCMANGLCGTQDNMLSYFVLIDLYNPSTIFSFSDELSSYFQNKSTEDFNVFKSQFKQEIIKSEGFLHDKNIMEENPDFSSLGWKLKAAEIAQKYSLQIDNYNSVLLDTFNYILTP